MKQLTAAALALLMIFTIGCSKDEDNPVDPPGTTNPSFTTSNVKEGAVFFSFDSQSAVDVWDIKFGKYTDPPSPALIPMFLLNADRIGDRHVRIYATEEVDLDAVTTVNEELFTQDESMEVQGANWFDYNPQTHTVSSKQLVYVLETADDRVLKFQIVSYAQANSTFTVMFSFLNADGSWANRRGIDFEIADTERLIGFTPEKVITEMPWDIKLTTIVVETPEGDFAYPGIVLNNEANVKAKLKDGTPFADVDASAEGGLSSDGQGNLVIGTECLDYDETTHRLSPFPNRVFIVESVAGKRAKFQMLSYYNDDGQSGYMKFEYVVAE